MASFMQQSIRGFEFSSYARAQITYLRREGLLQLPAREPPSMVTLASLIPLPYFFIIESSVASERVSYFGFQTKIANHFNFVIAAC